MLFFSDHEIQKGYSSLLSFTVPDINNTVTKLIALGAELDGPVKHEVHGKVIYMSSIFYSRMHFHVRQWWRTQDFGFHAPFPKMIGYVSSSLKCHCYTSLMFWIASLMNGGSSPGSRASILKLLLSSGCSCAIYRWPCHRPVRASLRLKMLVCKWWVHRINIWMIAICYLLILLLRYDHRSTSWLAALGIRILPMVRPSSFRIM